jgi:hypothetical protein
MLQGNQQTSLTTQEGRGANVITWATPTCSLTIFLIGFWEIFLEYFWKNLWKNILKNYLFSYYFIKDYVKNLQIMSFSKKITFIYKSFYCLKANITVLTECFC